MNAGRSRSARRWLTSGLVASTLLLSAAGCPARHTRDYGSGECVEYTPTCIWGTAVCEVDDRGCRVCTCAADGAPGRLQSDPSYAPRPVDPNDRGGRP
jgi:hypothetical protein